MSLICQSLRPDGKGVFVEAGANDGVAQSNTLDLETEGWTGLLIEPSQAAFSALSKNRPNNILENQALVGDPAVTQIRGTFRAGSLMGTAVPGLVARNFRQGGHSFGRRIRKGLGLVPQFDRVLVSATTLDRLLEKHQLGEIDLLVLDLEGYELQALRGLEFHRPRMLIIETRTWDAMPIADLLLGRGYSLVANLSNFTSLRNPGWSGDHQDYCWVQSSDSAAYQAVVSVVSSYMRR